mmetsp:Transcript_8441/g.26882  ORF Transcript_8441/g.26882 Transcript_8441/m.26882 type:complete len:210 (+) Transcript_8441:99-728(+)
MSLEQPKRPVGGAYGIFLSKHRAEFTTATKGQKASAISVMASERWKKLSDKDKEPYGKEFEVVKAKYEKDMKAFLDAGGEKKKGARALATEKRKEKEGGGKRRRLAKDPNKPKKPAGGAFGVFLNKNRAEFMKQCPGKITEATKLASTKWKALSDAEKKPLEVEYEKKMKEWKEAMKSYKPPEGDGDGEDGDDDGEGDEEEEDGQVEDQ